jgi:hypothetical protein
MRLHSSTKDWRKKRAATLMEVLLDATSPCAWGLRKGTAASTLQMSELSSKDLYTVFGSILERLDYACIPAEAMAFSIPASIPHDLQTFICSSFQRSYTSVWNILSLQQDAGVLNTNQAVTNAGICFQTLEAALCYSHIAVRNNDC